MSKNTEEIKKTLPALRDLYGDLAEVRKMDDLNYLLNQDPPKNWIKQHPYAKNHKYLPVDKVEYLLRTIFKDSYTEILREGTAFNGVYVVVRVYYRDPLTGEYKHQDGVGAEELQTKSGASPSDLGNINKGAIAMAFPIAEVTAIKDACHKIGRIFGADINRRDVAVNIYDPRLMTNEEKEEQIRELLETPGLRITEDERLNVLRILDTKEVSSYDKAVKVLTQKKPK